jgi:hypothetical protein
MMADTGSISASRSRISIRSATSVGVRPKRSARNSNGNPICFSFSSASVSWAMLRDWGSFHIRLPPRSARALSSSPRASAISSNTSRSACPNHSCFSSAFFTRPVSAAISASPLRLAILPTR